MKWKRKPIHNEYPVPVKTINPSVSKTTRFNTFRKKWNTSKMKRNNIKLYDEEKEEEKKKKKHLKILGSFFKVQTPYNLVSASSVLSSSSLLSCCCNILRSYGMAAFSCFFFFIFYIVVAILNCIYLHAALFEFELRNKKILLLLLSAWVFFLCIFSYKILLKFNRQIKII